MGSTASAETLSNALAAAYRSNPKLDAARATLRATDEEIARARSGYRPTLSGSADVSHERSTVNSSAGTSSSVTSPRGYSVKATQPLFSGGRTLNAVNEAEATVRAGRELLRTVEQTVLLDAATSYMDVIRDAAILGLRENNITVLKKDLHATRQRLSVGDVTRTDLAQTEARLAAAISATEAARATLKISRSNFERHIGHPPSKLIEPKLDAKRLPKAVEEAVRTAEREHPAIVAAFYREQAARSTVDRIWGELLPSMQLEATYSRRLEPSSQIDASSTTTVIGRLSVPLYSGGEVEARVRQAKHTHIGRIQEIQQSRQEISSSVIAAWAQFSAAKAQLISDTAQLAATRVALSGIRQEEKAGQRTLLDVLNAEQDMLNADVIISTTRRNIIVTAYTLLAAIGRLNVQEIGSVANVYDAEVHTNEVRHQWRGSSITHRLESWTTEVKPATR
ncbi:MAG: TolC family outer membrane protein [Hyphomicrobiaceae bacterium]|nr:TolC family outer membrane protein [Hyphomicrobiaceae bacterium]